MRKLTVVGSQKMVVFDDMETDRKVTIYDKSVSRRRSTDSYGEYVSVRFGDISIPRIANDEPLRLECQEFVDAIGEGARSALRRRARASRSSRCSRRCSRRSTTAGASCMDGRRDADARSAAARTSTSAQSVTIATTCEFGANVVVHDGCSIGAGTVRRRQRGARQAARARRPVDRPRAIRCPASSSGRAARSRRARRLRRHDARATA